MNRTTSNLIMFIAGAAIGSAVTCMFVKTKYEQLAQEEIESEVEAMREYFKAKETTLKTLKHVDEMHEVEDEHETYEALTHVYTSQSTKETKEKEESDMDRPYVISPDEYGDNYGEYNNVSLTYYADRVLVNDCTGEVVEDVDDVIGLESLEHFGEYDEPDSVFVRNDVLKTDFEILRDLSCYWTTPDDGSDLAEDE